jgi:protein TonB
MEPNKILQADVLDLLFEGRNKEYGAYELRKKYNKRILLALLITAALAAAAVGSTLLAKEINKDTETRVQARDVELAEIVEPEPPPPPPPPPPATPPPPPQIELTKFTPPVIKKDEEVQKQEVPPQDPEEEIHIAEITQEGIKSDIIVPPVIDPKGTIEPPKFDENEIFQKVEIEAKVDQRQWRRHLESQLQRYIEDAASQGMAPGQYTVHVRFLVERDGSVADVSVIGSDPGYGLGKGAVDVVKKGPKWSPGEQNGRKVRSYHTQPITFVISDDY